MDTASATSNGHRRRPHDRFIPFRPNLNVEESHAKLFSPTPNQKESVPGQYRQSGAKGYWRLLSDAFHERDPRILPMTPTKTTLASSPFPWSSPCLSPDEGYDSPLKGSKRKVATSPDCIMDMPGLLDDFYTNVLDWGCKNLIAVALNTITYIWNAETRDCLQLDLKTTESENYYVTALTFDVSGAFLAVADNLGDIFIYDIEQMKMVSKSCGGGKGSIGVLRWSQSALACGTQKGQIVLFDSRQPKNDNRTQLAGHKHEVCGLQFRDSTPPYLASGADDGLINIWDIRANSSHTRIEAHTACAKALAWCPWKSNILVSGGGSVDGHIRLWNVNSGEQSGEVYTKSQICGLLWSPEYHELVSAHGSTKCDNNDVILWNMKNSEFDPVATLRHHCCRPLHIALSPDRTTLASVGADEAMCLWKCFPKRKPSPFSAKNVSKLNLDLAIR
ncbi:hypothetical protein CHS0354_029181 [Potamilus streckersoni]|uniref:CDC20/Fizzy WD40 domain-containing protein n=1 Tax=Potamilus streckersoni TaxID=2493646 RepID=A0AAE0WCM1_9BIVA|nr:hypothetical protein CHS0354_029181 [Potamilus streckersoni]